jgi:hypothetical protein
LKLKVDPEFQSLIPPLRTEEFRQLETNLKMDGCTHPIVTWNKKILDGHNRYEICTRHNIPFDIDERKFNSREDAMDWIDRNQTGRRNLSRDDFYEILGRIYNRTKKTHAEAGALKKSCVQNEHGSQKPERTAAVIAKEFDVSESTVRRAGKFAEAVEDVRKNEPEITDQGRDAIFKEAKKKSRQSSITKRKEEPKQKISIEETCPSDVVPNNFKAAMAYAEMAVKDLARIRHDHPDREEAFDFVLNWIKTNR